MHQLAGDLLGGGRRALARALSLVENNDPQRLSCRIFPAYGKALSWGLPGAGRGEKFAGGRAAAAVPGRGDRGRIATVDQPLYGGAILGTGSGCRITPLTRVFSSAAWAPGQPGRSFPAAGEAVQLFDTFVKT